MQPTPLDRQTADRLLAGVVPPDDAPPGYSEVAGVLRAMTGPPSGGKLAGEARMAAAMAEAIAGHPAASPVPPTRRSTIFLRVKVASLVVASTMVASSGLAAAGALPGPAQNAASHVLAKLGVSVPGGKHKPAKHPDRPAAVDSQKETPVGPDTTRPTTFGLCNAFSSGRGGASGKRNDSVAFENLQDAAGRSAEEFCADATPGGKEASNRSGSDQDEATSPNGHGNGHRKGPKDDKDKEHGRPESNDHGEGS